MPMSLPDPTALQQIASDPTASVWVAASAGSGKTKVLVDRVLRLLLQRVSPDHILCITYTKAAAAEMLERITRRAREWVTLPDEELHKALTQLYGHAPTDTIIDKARSLFILLSDAMPGLRILTIHAFCQRMLNQFPLEARIAPHFDVLEEADAYQLQMQAKREIFRDAYEHKDSPLALALHTLIEYSTEFSFDRIIADMLNMRRHYAPLLVSDTARLYATAMLYAENGFTPDTTKSSLAHHHLRLDETLRIKIIMYAQTMMSQGGVTDKKVANALLKYTQSPADVEAIDVLVSELLTKEHNIRAKFPTQKVMKAHPDCAEELQALARRAETYWQDCCRLEAAHISNALLTLAQYYFAAYDRLKAARHMLDYDDLILKTLALLDNDATIDWVLFKLDGQIDHILIDEAQDTSLEQWRLSERLTEEFFAGSGARLQPRSLFVVGDEKQSIYSFQGAAPKAFEDKRHFYAKASNDAAVPFKTVPMHTSFRSSPAILSLVDTLFAQNWLKQAITSEDAISHNAYHATMPGSVTCYPLFEAVKKQDSVPWAMAHERSNDEAPVVQCAVTIATLIKGWLQDKRLIPATGKAVKAGDILILVRRRNALVTHLMRELKAQNVAVAGADRLQLHDHLATKDILALLKVMLDESDDMSLAAVLTSPIGNLSYEQLTILCANRAKGESVWMRLLESTDAHCQQVLHLLRVLQHKSRSTTLYSFLCHLLLERGILQHFTARMGEEVRDIIHNILFAAEGFDSGHSTDIQGFIAFMEQRASTLKRDMEQGVDSVRIMTIHGAKGLEAPIVLLPDTTTLPDTSRDTIIPYKARDNTPLVVARCTQDKAYGMFADAALQHKTDSEEEYLRLLYVALTRAKYEVHVFGLGNAKSSDIPQGSWFALIQAAMQTLQADTDETGVMQYQLQGNVENILDSSDKHSPTPIAEHLLKPADNVALLRTRYAPSALLDYVAMSGRDNELLDTDAAMMTEEVTLTPAQRGTLLHQCLEYQANTPYAYYIENAAAIITQLAPSITHKEHSFLLNTLQNLADHEEITTLLDMPSEAETSISGTLPDGKYISGTIDRLIITQDSVIILDFKTGHLPDADRLPVHYVAQMQAYRSLLSSLYPQYLIDAKLVYICPDIAIFPVI